MQVDIDYLKIQFMYEVLQELWKYVLQEGAVTWGRGFVNNFLRVSLACLWAAGQLQYNCGTLRK